MRAPYFLLLTLCLFCCQMSSGVGYLTGLGHRSDHYIRARSGGTCHFSSCPLFTKIEGTCYGGKAKCCL
uniref:Beta-defensin 1 n=1 Tax=Equus caballus TaxID=9796 RepID=A0A9E8JWP9_HORSE|nr:defensin beta-1 [Equus caballus]